MKSFHKVEGQKKYIEKVKENSQPSSNLRN